MAHKYSAPQRHLLSKLAEAAKAHSVDSTEWMTAARTAIAVYGRQLDQDPTAYKSAGALMVRLAFEVIVAAHAAEHPGDDGDEEPAGYPTNQQMATRVVGLLTLIMTQLDQARLARVQQDEAGRERAEDRLGELLAEGADTAVIEAMIDRLVTALGRSLGSLDDAMLFLMILMTRRTTAPDRPEPAPAPAGKVL